MFGMCVYAMHGIYTLGLTACRGDSWRDTVEKTPTIVCGHACGGTDGACDAPNHLPGRVSRLRADAPTPHPRPQSRPRHHAVPDGGVRRPCASVSRWPYVPHLVQLLSASGLSPMCLSPDRALVGPPTGPTPGLSSLPC